MVVIVAAVLPAAAARGKTTVDLKPAAAETRQFDLRRPPADLPPMHPGEAAVTRSMFSCAVACDFTVSEDGPATAPVRVRVTGVQVTADLAVTIWVPTNATPKLTAHEEGHRRIAETIYKGAEAAARAAAAGLDGATFNAASVEAAQKEVQSRSNDAGRIYIDRIGGSSARINDIYDDLTAHGTKLIAEEDAIRAAFAQYDQEVREKAEKKDR